MCASAGLLPTCVCFRGIAAHLSVLLWDCCPFVCASVGLFSIRLCLCGSSYVCARQTMHQAATARPSRPNPHPTPPHCPLTLCAPPLPFPAKPAAIPSLYLYGPSASLFAGHGLQFPAFCASAPQLLPCCPCLWPPGAPLLSILRSAHMAPCARAMLGTWVCVYRMLI